MGGLWLPSFGPRQHRIAVVTPNHVASATARRCAALVPRDDTHAKPANHSRQVGSRGTEQHIKGASKGEGSPLSFSLKNYLQHQVRMCFRRSMSTRKTDSIAKKAGQNWVSIKPHVCTDAPATVSRFLCQLAAGWPPLRGPGCLPPHPATHRWARQGPQTGPKSCHPQTRAPPPLQTASRWQGSQQQISQTPLRTALPAAAVCAHPPALSRKRSSFMKVETKV